MDRLAGAGATLAFRWLLWGEWRRHPGRVVLGVLAIAVGVALGFAVHLINGSALASFDRAVRGVNGSADLQVRAASRLGMPDAAYPRAAVVGGVVDASPVVELPAFVRGERLTLLGLDVFRAGAVTPSLVGVPAEGQEAAVFAEDAVFLSRGTQAALGARAGEEIVLAANGRTARLRVAGAMPGVDDDRRLAAMDVAAAQLRFGRLGRLDRVDLKLAANADPGQVRAALTAALPSGATLSSADAAAESGDALSRAYRVNLSMLAMVALLTGGFLVYSAQELSVARRLRSFALLRTLGLPRRGIIAQVAVEGLALGMIGAVLGLAGGYGLALLALRLLGGDLGGGYFQAAAPVPVFAPGAALFFLALGITAALGGSILPARAAARAAPAVALKNAGDVIDPRSPAPWRLALLLFVGGAWAAFLPAIGGLPLFGYLSIALLLAGGIALMPWLARALLDPLSRRSIRVPAVDLAVRRLRGAPGQAAVALCGIVASTALMIAMATMVASFRGAVDDWLGQVLVADLYLRLEGGGSLDPAAQAQLAAAPGVARIDFGRQSPVLLDPARPPVTLIVRPISPAAAQGTLPLLTPVAPAPLGAIAVWVSEPAARLYDLEPGEPLALPLGGRGARFVVAAVWRDYARQHGSIVIDGADYDRLTGDLGRDEAAVLLRPDASRVAAREALLARLLPELRTTAAMAEPQQLRRLALTLFDRSFAVTYVLEAVAILVGLAGVAATVSAQTVARAREFGMLRHIGMGRRSVLLMLGNEGALLGLVGGVAGVLLGLVLARVLISVVNPQSFNWTMATLVPWGLLAGVVVALVAAAAGTAVLAGRRATAQDALLSVREDW